MSYIEHFKLPDHISVPDLETLKQWKPDCQHEIKIFGKTHKVPRFQQAYGENYKYSNSISEAKQIPNELKEMINFFSSRYKFTYNAVLINWYCNGEHYISMHSDDEKQIEQKAPIITVSFGATRKFVTEEKQTKIKNVYNMENKDVISMCGDFQKTHKHGVPKQKHLEDLRVSITLRCFK